MDIWAEADEVIVVDAARSGAPAGTIHSIMADKEPVPVGAFSRVPTRRALPRPWSWREASGASLPVSSSTGSKWQRSGSEKASPRKWKGQLNTWSE
jgi:hypothetical protein